MRSIATTSRTTASWCTRLVTYLNNDENLSQTAKDLYAHRHTIRYRLQKIADITGLSVFRSEDKERLSLGLKARSLLNS